MLIETGGSLAADFPETLDSYLRGIVVRFGGSFFRPAIDLRTDTPLPKVGHLFNEAARLLFFTQLFDLRDRSGYFGLLQQKRTTIPRRNIASY